jgi:hypothetical protein
MEWPSHGQTTAGACEARIPSGSVLPHCSGTMRVGGVIVAHKEPWCATNGWRSACYPFRHLRSPPRKPSSPERRAPVLAGCGRHGWCALPVARPLAEPSSRSLASQKALPCSSACRRWTQACVGAVRSVLGEDVLSEWFLLPCFPAFPSVPLFSCSCRSPFCPFCRAAGHAPHGCMPCASGLLSRSLCREGRLVAHRVGLERALLHTLGLEGSS